MRFRPCIDLRGGRVVQIVGGSIRNGDVQQAVTNFETEQEPATYARLYQADRLSGGHVIALDAASHQAALSALSAFPGGMHYGGGVTPENAAQYLDAGASHVIVTSYVFRDGQINVERLRRLVTTVGAQRLVLDLSCRRQGEAFWVVTDRWQRFTTVQVNEATLAWLGTYCAEFLVHGVDVEGQRIGIDVALIEQLGGWSPLPVTYAGGARCLTDLDDVKRIGRGRVDLTIGSSLDIFGGDIPYREVVAWQRCEEA
ncbi:MAG: phosphoribosylformimino-5-aminoimidazole carboxamide ribotide isomerase [Chloroflexi bacterium]|nr:MAG: phosphoribosylformimino-5-aminoimidazole carboxamide ribotide isomerase [Chloroflexota bacterium]